MTTSTIPTTRNANLRSSIQGYPSADIAEEIDRFVRLRLHGRWEDIMAALDHWGIGFDSRSEDATSHIDDECAVYGTLRVEA